MSTVRYLSILLIIVCSGYISMAINDNTTEKTLYISPEMVPCVGVAPQMCLQVKENPNEKNYTYFYDSIEGFCYNPGFEYAIDVREEPVINPPADASSKKWILGEVITKTGNVTASMLQGVNWHLDSYLNKEAEIVCILDGTEITALFESERVTGNAGCDSYGAQYAVEGENLTISGIVSTLMFCEGPVSEQETDYLSNLERAVSYNVSGSLLKIMDANQSVMLKYSVVQPLSLTGEGNLPENVQIKQKFFIL